ncbi:Rieske 2Fe-2S domain-containing protein [Ilumatobacter nonamiensis]|uniref:Rieske 2Fe-2S domain-containing protein n=1 Tax=Ilumatobacter nonamiensis TaxID=467093 RepID=UPI00034AE5A5|nr:Rieske 2Fe-2S domain-containing protein [Ilumatobacter nonamiensis]
MNPLHRLTTRIEAADRLDAVAAKIRDIASPLGRPSSLRDKLTGRWLGHSVHPMLVAAPIGAWIGAAALDVTGASGTAARRLIGVGTLAAIPTAATGAADWFDTSGAEQRVGLAHAALNDVAVTLFAASWWSRRHGRSVRAIALSGAGLAAVGVAGYLGGHLAYVRGVAVNTTAFQSGPEGWTRLIERDELTTGVPVGATLDGLEFVVVDRTDRVDVLEDRCTHRGAPLSDGVVTGDCIECPWHGSRFDTATGMVEAGPASVPQPVYRTRVVDGWVEIRRTEVGGLRRNPIGAAHDTG